MSGPSFAYYINAEFAHYFYPIILPWCLIPFLNKPYQPILLRPRYYVVGDFHQKIKKSQKPRSANLPCVAMCGGEWRVNKPFDLRAEFCRAPQARLKSWGCQCVQKLGMIFKRLSSRSFFFSASTAPTALFCSNPRSLVYRERHPFPSFPR